MAAEDLTALGVAEAAESIRTGALTCEALVNACLARIAARDGEVRAWAHIDPELALRAARVADAARQTGIGGGPLHGVPIGIKDAVDTSDYPTECGCRALSGRQPAEDAAVVQALRSAGAIILGKTITTELATLTPSITRNPRNLAHTPGGSSSGSAAAVADGMVPAAIGAQTLGSVIRPAAFCGVFGYKPTFGLMPRHGVMAQSPSLDTLGIMARSITDLALLGDAVQVYDARDPASLAHSRPRLSSIAGMAWPIPPTFAFVKSPAWSGADPRMQEAFGELLAALAPRVVEIDLDAIIAEGLAAAHVIHRVEMAVSVGPLCDGHRGLVDDAIAATIAEGRRLMGVDYVSALAMRERHARILADVFANHGTILTPSAPGPAPHGLSRTGDPVFNTFWTYLGTPALTLPLLEVDGLPVGVQLVGARMDDGRLLRTGRLLIEQLSQPDDGA
ncbi:MAG: amidase [Hyphomicrobiaceae bacterium]